MQPSDEATWQVLFPVHHPHGRRKSFGIRTLINGLTKYIIRMGSIAISNSLALIIIIIFYFVYNLYTISDRTYCNLTDVFTKFILLVNFFITKQYPDEGIVIVYTGSYLR
jgi:hypothetical protein